MDYAPLASGGMAKSTLKGNVVWGALPDIADTQVDDLLQTDQSDS